jgi:hypothetical protein
VRPGIPLQNANNYHITRSNVLEDNARLYCVKDGKRKQFATWDGKVPGNVWNTLAVEAKGDTFRVFLNGKKVIEAKDKTSPVEERWGCGRRRTRSATSTTWWSGPVTRDPAQAAVPGRRSSSWRFMGPAKSCSSGLGALQPVDASEDREPTPASRVQTAPASDTHRLHA